MQIAIVGAGYSAGEADQLRRDMAAWKKSGKLLRHRERLLTGFAENGIPEVFGKALFEQIKGFGEYGFPESHAASFALLVYLSAWQKVHHPAHFLCAILNSQPMGFYSPASLVRDAQRHGVEVRPVDVCASNWDCTLERASHSTSNADARAVRLGLRQLKGLSQHTAEVLERARDRKPFTDLQDLRHRVPFAENQLRALAKAGALASLMPGRRQALWALGKPAQSGLFGGISQPEPEVQLPPLPAAQQLLFDYSTVGLSLQDHPMNHLRGHLRGVLRADALPHVAHEQRVTVAGLVQSRQRPATASGVVFVTLEDETGIINVVLFSALYERYRHVARHATLLLVQGRLERQVTLPRPGEVGRATAVIHVIAEHLERLDGRGTLRVPSRDFH
jgi:error-prone DNA polymerase